MMTFGQQGSRHMTDLRTLAAAAAVAAALPGAALAATASFGFSAGVDITIDAPGATIEVAFADADGDSFALGSASASFTTSPFDPATFDPSDFDLEASAAGEADPTGFAFAGGFAELLIDVINTTGADIEATVTWNINAEADAEILPTALADAFSFLLLNFVVETDSGSGPIVDEFLEVFADGFSGPLSDSDSASGSESWTLADDDILFVETFVEADGLAIAAVPVPPGLALLLTGVAGLGLMRHRPPA
jgi:hypothetical protein